MGHQIARDALERSLGARLLACSHDELRVIDRVLVGVERGRETYGPLDLATEQRDWSREAADEYRDALFYEACRAVSAEDKAREQLGREAAAELAGPPAGPPERLGDAWSAAIGKVSK